MGKRHQTDVMRRLLKEVTKCELCGATRHLEAHHIIPVVCGGSEEEDNIIIVCEACHTKLTPRSALTKMGLAKVKARNEEIIRDWRGNKLCVNEFLFKFYQRLDDELTERLEVGDLLDILDETANIYCGVAI